MARLDVETAPVWRGGSLGFERISITDLDGHHLAFISQRLEWFVQASCGSPVFDGRDWNVNNILVNGLLLPQSVLLSIENPEWCTASDRRNPSLQLFLVISELVDEAQVRMNDWSSVLDKLKCLFVGHSVIFHEISNAQGGRAGLTCPAVHQDLTATTVNLLDLVSYQVEVDVELGGDPVLHRDLDAVLLLVGHGGQLQGGVDNAGDAQLQETFGGDGPACCQEEVVGELGGVGLVILLSPAVPAAHRSTRGDQGGSDLG